MRRPGLPPHWRAPLRRALVWAAVAVVLAAVFESWRNPHFIVELSNQVWGCF